MNDFSTQQTRVERYRFSDGGRANAGFKGKAGDCVARAIAIASGLPYAEVYAELAKRNKAATGTKSARNGVAKFVFEDYLKELGFVWQKAPKFQGRKARTFDLPDGVCIARQARHLVAVLDGVAVDTGNTTHKMVYGYWKKI